MRNRQLRLAILKQYDSQSDFAEEIGTSPSTVSLVVNNRRKLSEEELIKWQHFLNCKFQDIHVGGGMKIAINGMTIN